MNGHVKPAIVLWLLHQDSKLIFNNSFVSFPKHDKHKHQSVLRLSLRHYYVNDWLYDKDMVTCTNHTTSAISLCYTRACVCVYFLLSFLFCPFPSILPLYAGTFTTYTVFSFTSIYYLSSFSALRLFFVVHLPVPGCYLLVSSRYDVPTLSEYVFCQSNERLRRLKTYVAPGQTCPVRIVAIDSTTTVFVVSFQI